LLASGRVANVVVAGVTIGIVLGLFFPLGLRDPIVYVGVLAVAAGVYALRRAAGGGAIGMAAIVAVVIGERLWVVRPESAVIFAVAVGAVATVLRPVLRVAAMPTKGIADLTNAERSKAFDDVLLVGRMIGNAPNLETATFLFDEAKAGFERVAADSEKVEGKAATMLTIVGGAAGALGVFGVTKDARSLANSPSLIAAACFAACALIALLVVLRGKAYAYPTVDDLLSGPMIAEDRRAGTTLLLAQSYCRARDALRKACRWDSTFIVIALAAVTAAAVLALLGAVTSPAVPSAFPSAAPRPTPRFACARPPTSFGRNMV
jgi:hypothetical protein